MNAALQNVLSRLENVEPSDDHQFSARCPGHDDQRNSLAIGLGDDGKVLLNCFVGCSVEDILQPIGLEISDLFPEGRQRTRKKHGLTLQALQRDKQLPAAFLRKIGVKPRGSALQITYYTEDGEPAGRQRKRYALSAKDGSSWYSGLGKPIPYGLWRLDEAREAGFLIIVEGESDTWTLWHHGYPALGLPGADMAKKLQPKHVEGLSRVYVVREPDRGGKTFLDGITRRLETIGFDGMVYAVPMPKDVKDPNGMHKKDRQAFPHRFDMLLENALPQGTYPYEAFAAEMEGLDREEAESRALDLLELCATMNRTDFTRADHLLKQKGAPTRFRQSWRTTVRAEKKELKERREAIEEEEEASTKGLTAVLAETILETEHFARDAGNHLFHYRDGVYHRKGERISRRKTKEILKEWEQEDAWSSYRASEVTEYIRVDRAQLWERPLADRLNLKNGILHLETGELKPHTPEFLSLVQLPVEYDPEATCPAWDRFCKSTFPKDAYEANVHWQIVAWLIDLNTSIQKALLLLGDGGNGKSVYLGNLASFLGERNVTNKSLHFLENNRFATAALQGRLANICPDLPSAHLSETIMFKAIVGGDRIPAEYKHGENFDFLPFCKLLFSANHPPRSSDSSDGFYRRWLTIPFNKTFKGEERVPRAKLDAALQKPEELSGLLNKALQWLPHVRKKGITETPSMKEALKEFREVTDPFSVWVRDYLVEHPEIYVSCSDLRKHYNQTAKKEGWPPMNKTSFGIHIKQEFPKVEVKRRTLAGGRERCYIGIGLQEGGRSVRSSDYLQRKSKQEDAHTGNNGSSVCVKDPELYKENKENSVHSGHSGKPRHAPFSAGQTVVPTTDGEEGIVEGCQPTNAGGWIVSLRDGRNYSHDELSVF